MRTVLFHRLQGAASLLKGFGICCALCGLLWPASAPASSPPIGTIISNRVKVTYADASGNPLPQVEAAVQTPVSGAPVLKIRKIESSNPVDTGASLVYSIQYENTGNAPATGATITDLLSRHVLFQSASGSAAFSPGPPEGGTVKWTLGTVAAGESGTATVMVNVKTSSDYSPGDPNIITTGTLINNTATLISNEGSDQFVVTTRVGSAPGLEIKKYSTSGPVAPGSIITYNIEYANRGNQPASNVRIRDEVPRGAALVPGSVTGGGNYSAGTIEWYLGSVDPGVSSIVEFQVKVSASALEGDLIQNTAVMLSNEQGVINSNQVSSTVSTLSTLPTLSITKTDSPDPVFVNNSLTYTIKVTNEGSASLTDVVIHDTVPPNTSFVSSSGGDAGGTLTGSLVEWKVSSLAPGATATVQMVVNVDPGLIEGSIIRNSAEVIAKEIPHPTPTTTTTVSARTQGRIEFFDTSWSPAGSFSIGDNICLQVTDPDRNEDPNTVESLGILLSHPNTGDSENITLLETSADSGVFRGCILSSSEHANTGNGIISVSQDSSLTARYTDPLDASPVSEETCLIDPFGVVFDSVTGARVSGAVVTLHWRTGPGTSAPASTHPAWPAAQPDTVTTGVNGAFAFPLVPPGTFFMDVSPGGSYVFPSAVPTSELPAGFVIGVGSRGEDFTLAPGDPALNLDLPVDPPAGQVAISKTANKNTAAIGDIVRYSIDVTNSGVSPATNIKVKDIMPHGVQYIKGSTSINGTLTTEPQVTGARTLVWNLPDIPGGEFGRIIYLAVVGPDAHNGDGTNRVYAEARSVAKAVTSNIARFKLKITGGVFTSKGTILGRVFYDKDGDGIQNDHLEKPPISHANTIGADELEGEAGVPGVLLFLEDGTRVKTDRHGKFSIHGVRPGTHVLRLDETTLPEGFEPVPVSNRFMGSSTSQFLDIVPGGLFKANFAVKKKKGFSLKDKTQSGTVQNLDRFYVSQAEEPQDRGLSGKAKRVPPEDIKSRPLEEMILEMTPDLAFLSPAKESVIGSERVDVIIKAPFDTELSLRVNQLKVPDSKIGRKITNKKGRVSIYEFVSVDLEPGKINPLKAEVRDPFGNVRAEKEIAVTVAGKPAKIEVIMDKKEIPADGVSLVKVRASVLDKNGVPLTCQQTITVSVSAGEILEKDEDPSTGGIQLPCNDGLTTFTVRAPYETGHAEITVIKDGMKKKVPLFFSPQLREMIVVGIGEVTLGYGSTKGDITPLKEDKSLDKKGYAGGRGAAFVKGKITDDILLTAAFDSEKEEADELFRTEDQDLEAEDKYPVYGDESELGYEAVSKEKLYVRLDKNRSHILYGDYLTKLDSTKLTAYTRSFNGINWVVDTDQFKLQSFASSTDQSKVVDILPGRGISGYYYLNHQPIIEGSESVIIETRDRWRPDRILKKERMSRWSDYSINYESGGLLFKMPVSSHDAEFNPIYIIASYETEKNGKEYYVYGGRGALKITEWLEMGVTGIAEENEIDDSHILGTDLTLQMPWNTTLTAEAARTAYIFDVNGTYEQKKGHGWSLEMAGEPLEQLSFSAYYRTISDYFGNMSAIDVMRGTDKYGIEVKYQLRPDLSLRGNFFDEKDKLNNGEFHHASVGMTKRFRDTKIDLDLSRETSKDRYIPPSSINTREPFDISEDTPDEAVEAGINIETKLMPDLFLLLGHKQDIQHNDYNLSSAGLTYKVDDLTRAYVREEYGKYMDRKEARTLIGVESEVADNLVTFSEYRLDSGADGSRNDQIVGLRNKFMLGKKITGNFSVEKLQTVTGNQRRNEPDAFGITGALEYLPKEDIKLTSRGEYRKEETDLSRRSYLAEFGSAFKVNKDYSLLFKERYFYDSFEGSGGRVTSRTMLGLAYRPVKNDRLNMLSKVEYKKSRDTVQAPQEDTDAFIASVEGVCQVNRRLQLIGKYAGKLARDSGFENYTDLLSARVLFDISPRFDIGLEYRVLNSHDTGSVLHGGAFEVGYRLIKNLWVSLGYSLDDFDADLTDDDYRGSGPYLKIRFKFDEQALKSLKKARMGP